MALFNNCPNSFGPLHRIKLDVSRYFFYPLIHNHKLYSLLFGLKHHLVVLYQVGSVSLSKNINPSLVLVQPRKIRLFITERLLMGRKESNKQTNKTKLALIMAFGQNMAPPRGHMFYIGP